MKYDEIMKLIEAGYNREEILAMQSEPEVNVKEPEPAPEEIPESGDNTSVVVDELSKAVSEMKKTFEGVRNEIQALNIMNSQIANNEISSEDIIANIINPFENKD